MVRRNDVPLGCSIEKHSDGVGGLFAGLSRRAETLSKVK